MRAVFSDLLAFRRHPALLAWGLFLLAIPFYVVASGLPQPGNSLIVIILPLAFYGWNRRLHRQANRAIRSFFVFTFWTTIVSTSWFVLTAKEQYLVFPFYFLFNAIVFSAALILHERYRDTFIRVTAYAVFAAVIVQVASSFVLKSDSYRSSLFFNNPNQLGYYSLLAASVIALCQRKLGMGMLGASLGLTGCVYLALLSASRAAAVGILLLLFLLLFANPRIVLIMSLAAVGGVTMGGSTSSFEVAQERANMNRNMTFAEERGYDRLWHHPHYLVVGAGEGDLSRFSDDPRDQHEIHSSIATILFCYGLIGALLFSLFIARVLEGATFRAAIMLAPAMSYSISHQGLRFTMLWVVLAVFVSTKVRAGPRLDRQERTPRALPSSGPSAALRGL